MTCCCQSIHQRRRWMHSRWHPNAAAVWFARSVGVAPRLFPSWFSGKCLENEGGNYWDQKKTRFSWKTMIMWGRVYSCIDMSVFFVHDLFNRELKILMKPNPKLKDLGWMRDCGSQNVVELEKWPVKKRKQVSTFSKVWWDSWKRVISDPSYSIIPSTLTQSSQKLTTSWCVDSMFLIWNIYSLLKLVMGDMNLTNHDCRSLWKRVRMWEYCHAGMSAPPFVSYGQAGDGRNLNHLQSFHVKHRCFGTLKHCGLGLFSNDTEAAKSRHIHGNQSVTTTSQWDPQLMALLGEVASTYTRYGCDPFRKHVDCKLPFPSCSQLSIKLMFQIYFNCSVQGVKWRNKSTDYCYSCSCVEVRVFGACCIQ